MRILIAVPTFENIYPDTFRSIWNLVRPAYIEADFDFVRGYDCARARSNIAKEAIEGGYDYVLMVDNDTVLPKDALINLLEGGEDVVVGYYAHRTGDNVFDGRTNMCKLGEYNYTNQYKGSELKDLLKQGQTRVQIHGGGLGCALIKVGLFNRLEYPYFNWVNYESGYVLSEDLYFAERCKDANVAMWCDTRVECGHIFRHVQYTTE